MKVSCSLERLLESSGVQMTRARRLIARVLCESHDHPNVQLLHKRAVHLDASISIATIYRTLKLFQELGLLERHTFGSGIARYEPVPEDKHDHLVDIDSDEVIEFRDEEIDKITKKIAERLGYVLVDHRLELYGFSLETKDRKKQR